MVFFSAFVCLINLQWRNKIKRFQIHFLVKIEKALENGDFWNGH